MTTARRTEGSGPTTSANAITTTIATTAAARRGGRGPARAAPTPSRHQRHVEAGDGQHVIDAGAPEGLVDVARQLRPVAEQEPGE